MESRSEPAGTLFVEVRGEALGVDADGDRGVGITTGLPSRDPSRSRLPSHTRG